MSDFLHVLSPKKVAVAAAFGLGLGVLLHTLPDRNALLILASLAGIPILLGLVLWWGYENHVGTCGSRILVGLTRVFVLLLVATGHFALSSHVVVSMRYRAAWEHVEKHWLFPLESYRRSNDSWPERLSDAGIRVDALPRLAFPVAYSRDSVGGCEIDIGCPSSVGDSEGSDFERDDGRVGWIRRPRYD